MTENKDFWIQSGGLTGVVCRGRMRGSQWSPYSPVTCRLARRCTQPWQSHRDILMCCETQALPRPGAKHRGVAAAGKTRRGHVCHRPP